MLGNSATIKHWCVFSHFCIYNVSFFSMYLHKCICATEELKTKMETLATRQQGLLMPIIFSNESWLQSIVICNANWNTLDLLLLLHWTDLTLIAQDNCNSVDGCNVSVTDKLCILINSFYPEFVTRECLPLKLPTVGLDDLALKGDVGTVGGGAKPAAWQLVMLVTCQLQHCFDIQT